MSVKHKIILSKKQINIIFIILISIVIIVGLSYFGMKLVYSNIYSKSIDTLKLNNELFETTSEETESVTSNFENTENKTVNESNDKSSKKDTTSNSSSEKQNIVTDNNTSTDTLSKDEKKIAEYNKIVTNLTTSNTALKNEITELDNTVLAYKKDLSEEKTKLIQFKKEYEDAKLIFRKEYINDKNEIVYIYDEEKLKPYNEKIKNSESKIQDIDSKIIVVEKEKYAKETSISNNNKDILKYKNEIDKLK